MLVLKTLKYLGENFENRYTFMNSLNRINK